MSPQVTMGHKRTFYICKLKSMAQLERLNLAISLEHTTAPVNLSLNV